MRGEGSRGHTQSGLLFGPHSEARCRQSPEGQGSCLTRPPSSSPPLHCPLPPGLENWVWAEDMAFVPAAIPWSPEHQIQRVHVTRKQLETEEQAAFPLKGPPLATCTWPATRATSGGTLAAIGSRPSALLGGRCPRTAPWREPSAGGGGWGVLLEGGG